MQIYCARGHTFDGPNLDTECPVLLPLGQSCGLYGHTNQKDAEEEAADMFEPDGSFKWSCG